MTDLNFLDFITKNFLDQLAETFQRSLLFLELLLFIFSLVKLDTLFGAVLELMSIKVLELLDNILVNGVNHVDDFKVLLFKGFNEG